MTTIDPATVPPRAHACNGRGHSCGSIIERSKILGDLVVASSPGWVRYAVAEACSGRLPRTMSYLLPSLTGGMDIDLGGRIVLRRGMAFVGETDAGATVNDAAEAPARVLYTEDAGDVVFDDFESMGWPAIRAPGGAA